MSASRPVVSTVENAACACSGLRSASRRAAAACTVIALSAWATTSCSSPAIRVRSSSAALSAAPSRLSASCSAFSRSAVLSRARLRMTVANSIGAATPSATEFTNAVMSFGYGSVAVASALSATPTKAPKARWRPSVCAPTV